MSGYLIGLRLWDGTVSRVGRISNYCAMVLNGIYAYVRSNHMLAEVGIGSKVFQQRARRAG